MTDLFNTTTVEPKLEDFVGEGKKYSDAQAVAKALVEKDAFIARLQEEARRKEADLQSALNTKAFEDRVKALEAEQLAQRVEPTTREATPPPQAPVIDEAVIARVMDEREKANARTRNLMEVKDKLTQVYGEEYSTRVKARASELNISLSRLNEMAAETPNAFYALIGLDTQRAPAQNVTPPATQQNTAAFNPNTTVKNNAYYTNLRKTNPSLYWTPKVQMEEYNELKRQGDAFGL